MIRFPNPGSDIPSLIRIFNVLYTRLHEKSWFTLDDMSKTLTGMNLAASSGHVGERALALSTRENRSLDPLYNQSKMYAELFRILGWMVSDNPNAALKFRFTLLGGHASAADVDPKAIFEESVLGINYPNQILAIKGTEATRVFSAVLKAALRLDGWICRDEIIIGILNMDDTGEEGIENIVSVIKSLRGKPQLLTDALVGLSERIGIQVNTMRNYTRFPIAVLTYCGWFEKERRQTVILQMTPYGKQRANHIDSLYDVRLSDYEACPASEQAALIRLGFYSMLQRANFDITPALAQLAKENNKLGYMLFSPYQTIRPETADLALGYTKDIPAETYGDVNELSAKRLLNKSGAMPVPGITQPGTTIRLTGGAKPRGNSIINNPITSAIVSMIEQGYTDMSIANFMMSEYEQATKYVFYPLVADLFSMIGFNCRASRSGINYERWDAIINDDHSIPIEIKSPTEELFISVKAIRQALENKVVLLSRKSYPTDWGTVTLAVGYHPPNERAEVSRLIADVKNVFNIRIGVIDFKALVMLASSALRGGRGYLIEEIRKMEGIINVEWY